MLRVTIANIDESYTGIFDTDDEKTAAKQALADLQENHGFFPKNVIIDRKRMPHTYGMLILEDENNEEDITYAIDDENTHWIYIRPVEFGRMIWS